MPRGLDIQFWSRTADPADCSKPMDESVVRRILDVMVYDRANLPFDEEAPSCGCEEHVIPWALKPTLHLVALEHDGESDLWQFIAEDIEYRDSDEYLDQVAKILASKRAYFIDFLCAYIQKRFTCHNTFDGSERYSATNNSARKKVTSVVNGMLELNDLVILDDGNVVTLSSYLVDPINAQSSSTNTPSRVVNSQFIDAQRELLAGHPADAITDIGSALQSCLAELGFDGNTLKIQLNAVEKSGVLKGVDVKLLKSIEFLTAWLSGVRNTKSDAHHHPSGTLADSLFALRIAIAFAEFMRSACKSDADTKDHF